MKPIVVPAARAVEMLPRASAAPPTPPRKPRRVICILCSFQTPSLRSARQSSSEGKQIGRQQHQMGLPSSIDAGERAFSATPLLHRHGWKIELVADARVSMPPEPADRIHLPLVDVLGDRIDRAFSHK